MRSRRAWFQQIAIGSMCSRALLAGDATPLRLMVVTGGHSFDPKFWTLFEGRPGWKLEKREHQAPAVGCSAYDQPFASTVDAMLLYDMPKEITEVQQRHFLDLFDRGVGVVVLHHALVALQNWPVFNETTGIRSNEKGDGGLLPKFIYQHDVEFELQRVDTRHPVLDGVPSFQVLDETYGRSFFHTDIQPLLVTNHPTSSPIVAWSRTYRKSRLVMIQPGHGPGIFADANYRRLIGNAVAWVAAGRRAQS